MSIKEKNDIVYLSEDLEVLLNTKVSKIESYIELKNNQNLTADVIRKDSLLDTTQLTIKCSVDNISDIEQFDINLIKLIIDDKTISSFDNKDYLFNTSWNNLNNNLYELEIFICRRFKDGL